MPTYLALKIPGTDGTPVTVDAPDVVPSGGLEEGGAGTQAITNGITIFLVLIAVASLFMLIYGGVKWIMSEGDKSKVDSARKTITYAIIGLVVAFLAFFIVNTVGGFFGFNYF